MIRLMPWLFMSFRWLLVAVLPVLSLIVGLRLKPEITPRWKVDIESRTKCGGLFHDHGMHYLLLEGGPSFDMALPAIELVGLEMTTGREERIYKIPQSDFKQHELVIGSSKVIYGSSRFRVGENTLPH